MTTESDIAFLYTLSWRLGPQESALLKRIAGELEYERREATPKRDDTGRETYMDVDV